MAAAYISINKCCAMHIGNNTICRPVSINGSILPVLSSCRDLGVLVSSDPSPSVHTDSIVAKAISVPMLYYGVFFQVMLHC